MGNLLSPDKLDTSTYMFMGSLPYPLSVLSHILIRLKYYNGSLDKIWIYLLLPFFLVPPLTYFPLMLLVGTTIRTPKISNNFELLVIVPMLISLLLDNILEGQELKIWQRDTIKISLLFLSILAVNVSKSYQVCTDKNMKERKCTKQFPGITTWSIAKAFTDSIKQVTGAQMLVILHELMSSLTMIPKLKYYFKFMHTMIPKSIVWSIGYLLTVSLTDGINVYDTCNYCETSKLNPILDGLSATVLPLVCVLYYYVIRIKLPLFVNKENDNNLYSIF
jgi:hypothetical protein